MDIKHVISGVYVFFVMVKKVVFNVAVCSAVFTVLHVASSWASVASTIKSAGIGITVAQLYDDRRKDHKGRVVVLDLLKNGPSALVGVEKGDIITHIDGKATKGRSLERIIAKLLRGEAGSFVELKIYRTEPPRLLNIRVTRDFIH